MGRGKSKVSKVQTPYDMARDYIKGSGIPTIILTPKDSNSQNALKQIYSAIADYGKLTAEEQAIYDKIKTYVYVDDAYLWYNGSTRSIVGFTEKEITGAKMFMSHSVVENRKRGK